MKVKNFVLYLGCTLCMGGMAFATPKKQVIAGPEDTVYGIAYNNGIPTRALISANNLKPPYVLTNGQILTIPGSSEHIVGDGESLQSIAENYGVNIDILAQENNIQSPFFITPGTSLSIPSRDTTPMAEALQPASSHEISTSSLEPLSLIKSAPPSASTSAMAVGAALPSAATTLPDDLAAELAREKGAPAGKTAIDSSLDYLMGILAEKKQKAAPVVSEEEKKEEQPKKAAKKEEPREEKKPAKKEAKKEPETQEISFIWPVNGDVISKFGAGGKNDGIDIKVATGTPVKASADGKVMYAGSELKGFGNLLLIKHEKGWVTAYAHNAELLVSKGDKVKQGQEIAKSGKPEGDATQPQLHFEIRKVKQPIDPLSKLES